MAGHAAEARATGALSILPAVAASARRPGMTAPPNPSLTAVTAGLLKRWVDGWTATPNVDGLESGLRLLAKWRSQMLARTYVARHGVTVFQGPFAGMAYLDQSTEGALIARLLGCYEAELHPHLAAIAAEGLDCVIDVGCAEGYYAVGLARQLPEVTVYAHDISDLARAACEALAAKNGVADRVIVGGEVRPEDFEAFAGRRVLVLVDAEGAELDVLRPDLSPALAAMSLIVETHDVFRPGALATLVERFSPTHEITRVDSTGKIFEMPGWMKTMSHLDQLLATWEWREKPTPWLVMRPKVG